MGNRGTVPPEQLKLMLRKQLLLGRKQWPDLPGYSAKVDVYALGVVLYWMIVNELPFDRNMVVSDEKFAKKVLKGQLRIKKGTLISQECLELILECCAIDDEYRISMS